MGEEAGIRGRLKAAQEGGHGQPLNEAEEPEKALEEEEGAQRMENEGEVRDPKQEASRLLTEGQTSVSGIAHVTGLSEQAIWGLKGILTKRGELPGKERQREEPPRRQEGKPDPLQDMRDEMSRTLEEELMSVPGASEKASAYILKRFASDDELIFDAYKLHALIARFNPRLSDADVVDIVQRVQRVSEAYHLDRLKGMEAFQGYRGGLPRSQGRPNYDVRAGLIPGYGQQEPSRTYTESDVQNERRVWNLERRQDELNNFLEKTNQTLEKILERTDKPPAENESVERLGDKIERLQEDLAKKDKEFDAKEREHMQSEIGGLKSELKELRGNVGEWRSDEYKILGNVMDKAVSFGEKVLAEAPLSKAAQNVATALMPAGSREVPPEARETVLSLLKREGLTVPE